MMERTFSTRTLNMVRMNKPQIYLLILNTLLLLSGISQTFFGTVLCGFYHLDKLHYIYDGWLYTFPMTLLGIGLSVMFISSLGLVFTLMQNRHGLLIFSILMLSINIPQMATLYMATKVNHALDFGLELRQQEVSNFLYTAYDNRNETSDLEDFFYLQEHYSCCGLVGATTGISFWNNDHFRDNDGIIRLPHSCCRNCTTCSCKTVQNLVENIRAIDKEPVYRTGCLLVIDTVFRRDLKVLIDPGFVIFGIGCVVIEFLAMLTGIIYYNILRKREKKLREKQEQAFFKDSFAMSKSKDSIIEVGKENIPLDNSVDALMNE